MKRIHKIIQSDLCLGCGFCETLAGRDRCEMTLTDNGFYQPRFKQNLDESQIRQILEVCPGIRIDGKPAQGKRSIGIWGSVRSVAEAWSADKVLRKRSASGGVISSLAIFLLESKQVDAILQVGVQSGSWLYNELCVSRSKEDVWAHAQSRYAPALVFDRIQHLLDSGTETYGFIGKPCDIAGLNNFIRCHPQYKGRIAVTIALFCAGIPSYRATGQLLERAGMSEVPQYVKYRGDGWPGLFEAGWKNGKTLRVSYNDSWGKVLGRTLGLRCKICPDGIGLLADIATGDSWNTKDGYPDFTEADGKNICFLRSRKGEELFQAAVQQGVLVAQDYPIQRLKAVHTYQYARRRLAGWRIAAIQLATHGLLHFSGLGIGHIQWGVHPLKALKEFSGALLRFHRRRTRKGNE